MRIDVGHKARPTLWMVRLYGWVGLYTRQSEPGSATAATAYRVVLNLIDGGVGVAGLSRGCGTGSVVRKSCYLILEICYFVRSTRYLSLRAQRAIGFRFQLFREMASEFGEIFYRA